MQISLQNTSKIVHINDVPARVWEGETESGIKVHAFITRIMVNKDDDAAEFEKELEETKAPTPETMAIPLRMIL